MKTRNLTYMYNSFKKVVVFLLLLTLVLSYLPVPTEAATKKNPMIFMSEQLS